MATDDGKAAAKSQENPAPVGPRAPPSAAAPKRSMTATASRGAGRGWLRLAGLAAGPLAVVGVWLLVGYVGRKKKRTGPGLLRRSVSMSPLYGVKTVIERMAAAREVEENPEKAVSAALQQMRNLLDKERVDFVELHRVASILEMSGREDEAIKILDEALKKAKKSSDDKSHDEYELQMLLLEMRIYKGEYDEKALEGFVTDANANDARIPLFKAIIQYMLGKNAEAENSHKKFQELMDSFYSQDTFHEKSKFYRVVKDFEEFEKVVKLLKDR